MAETLCVAGCQFDCQLGAAAANRSAMAAALGDAAARGAGLVVFPECAASGYGFGSLAEAWPHAEPLDGPTAAFMTGHCRQHGIHALYGFLEREGEQLFNSAALVGPGGIVANYRKTHLPFLGVDRFATPGDRPYAVHEVAGTRIGILICYDGSFPEAPRVLTLLGADLIVLITNWPEGAVCSAAHIPEMRAHENHVYFLAVNRVGSESGFRFIGRSRLVDWHGTTLAGLPTAEPGLFLADVDPAAARAKRVVNIPGAYELDRIAHRRPELYGLITAARASD
ncbi:MAG TPA: carbon-nitrogen hydrolase family protein [Gemmatales bacterium]|nr:carbon-nitrogen hydrolase family protein [Gemmatales bacterium]HMP59446.1 carbon-nitrogen hydrolase family protein [Gemmatales bacterium]